MNILFITEYLPYFPCYDGFRLVPYNILQELSKRHNIHLISFVTSAEEECHKKELLDYCSTVETVYFSHEQTKIKKIKNVFSRYAWKDEMYEAIHSALKKYDVDLLHVEGAHIAQYAQGINDLPKIIMPHDSPAARAYTLFKLSGSGINKIKTFIDWLKAVSYEKTVYRQYGHCIVVGPSDKEVINKHCPKLKTSVISNGVDLDFYKYKPIQRSNNSIIFTGNMSYEPNVNAVLYFCDKIYPLLKRRFSDIKFYIVGSSPVKAVTDLQCDNSIIVTGRVDDIRKYVYDSSVYACPMKQGTGIKNKILEAMSMGVPIVATKLSAVGIKCADEDNIIIEDDPNLFADKVADLLTNKDKALNLAKNAKALVDSEYGWEQKALMIEKIIYDTRDSFKKRRLSSMPNILGICLDYLMLKNDKVRGDVRQRQLDYAKRLGSLTLVVYSPKELNLKPQQWADNLWVYPTNSISKVTFILDAYKIASGVCKERKIDAITSEDPFTTGLVGYALKKRFNIPLNVQAHIDFVDNIYWMQLRSVNKFFNKLGKFICKRADTIRVVASETKESLESRGIATEKVSLVSVHSTLEHFNNPDDSGLRQQFIDKGFEHILFFVGRLVDQKDIPNLFAAFKYILERKPKTLLLLAGKGPKREFLENLARKKGILPNVSFLGSIEHSEIQKYYAASDIFLLPSIFEGRATVLVEAILSKKPIVTTDVSGLKEWLVEGETGFIVKRKDPKAFAEKVIYLLDNHEIATSFGEKGYSLAKSKIKEISDISPMIDLWERTAKAKI